MSELSPQPITEPLFSKELQPVLSWYKETCAKLPEMKVNITPLKDAKESHVNPSFFSYANVDVNTPQKSWQQGGILQEGNNMTVLLLDPDGRTFITVSQEPMAKAVKRGTTEIHPVVRSPLQTSTEKLKRKNDPVMKAILDELGTDTLNHIPFSPSPTDGNRMQSDVQYGTISVNKDLAKRIAEKIPNGRWATQKELDALAVLGVTNGNLNIGRSITEAQRRLQSL